MLLCLLPKGFSGDETRIGDELEYEPREEVEMGAVGESAHRIEQLQQQVEKLKARNAELEVRNAELEALQ